MAAAFAAEALAGAGSVEQPGLTGIDSQQTICKRNTETALRPPTRSVEDLIRQAAAAGNAALLKTPDQLVVNGVKVLKNFRGRTVVDSGAQGFCYLLDGMVLGLDDSLTHVVLGWY